MFGDLKLIFMCRDVCGIVMIIIGLSGPSLLTESTNSVIFIVTIAIGFINTLHNICTAVYK